jgi:hypothetical protein
MWMPSFDSRLVFRVFCLCLGWAVVVQPIRASGNDPVPAAQLLGTWKDAQGAVAIIETNENGEMRLTRNSVIWEEVYPYKPGPLSMLMFRHKPTIEELPDDMPPEIKEAAVAADLEWRLRLNSVLTGYPRLGNQCRLFLEGEFQPGEVKWDTIIDKNTGEKTNVFKSAKIGGPPDKIKKVELKQVRYSLPKMGQWLRIEMNLDETSRASGMGAISTIPLEAQAYTYLGQLDAAILEGMYNAFTLAAPLEGVAKYAVKLTKDLTKKKLEGESTDQAVLDSLGKLVGGKILEKLLPLKFVPEDLQPFSNKVRDKVAGELTKKGTTPLGEQLFTDEEAKRFKAYFVDPCRFRLAEVPVFNNDSVNLAVAVVDTKAGEAHFIFVAPRRKLNTGGEFPGAVFSGDISLPEEGEKPKPTVLILGLTYVE